MITLRNAQLQEIFAHARKATPFECCGLIGGANERASSIHPLRNIANNPQRAYEAAPEELFAAQRQMREHGEQLLAIYHSHPRSTEPVPSKTDVRLAYYPAAIYLIVGLGGATPIMRGFRISERGKTWQQVEYDVADE
ncbi:MAG: M67 family metallopeptidase [Pyrinomonadaceae bacterium]|nr:M67 family metallopeptidase [Pyrinomonadaceae bacterium]